jgi:hypothetical protein
MVVMDAGQACGNSTATAIIDGELGCPTATPAPPPPPTPTTLPQPSNYKTIISPTEYTYTFVRPGKLGLLIVAANPMQTRNDPGGAKVSENNDILGIEYEDKLVAIGDEDVRNWSVRDVVNFMIGHSERPVTLKFQNRPLFPRTRARPHLHVDGTGARSNAEAAAIASPPRSLRQSVVQDVNESLQSQSSREMDPCNLLSTTTISDILSPGDCTQQDRKRKKMQEINEDRVPDMEYPIVTGTQFDRRFLEYQSTPYGIHYEKLLRKKNKTSTDPQTRKRRIEMLSDSFLEDIPDEPAVKGKMSRVGPLYQASVSHWSEQWDGPDEELASG